MKSKLSCLQDELKIKIAHFEEIDSTMSYVNDRIRERGTLPDIVVADYQTKGVGRVGRSFYSPRSTGLYFTMVFSSDKYDFSDVTPRVAVSVRDAIEDVLLVSCGIKWVNDLYYMGRKVCGIICRNYEGFISIGVGINLEKPTFIPDDISNRIGFLTEKCSADKRVDLLKEIYLKTSANLKKEKDKILKSYSEHCIHLSKKIVLYQNNSEIVGICIGISDDFSLIVNVDGVRRTFSSGEMSLRI